MLSNNVKYIVFGYMLSKTMLTKYIYWFIIGY